MNFDKKIDRLNTNSVKWDLLKDCYGEYTPDDTIAMWVADTDFLCPPELIEAVKGAYRVPILGYKLTTPEFEKAVCNWLRQRFGYEAAPESVVKIPSVLTGVAAAVQCFTNEGDEVIIQTPVYSPFSQIPRQNNRVVLENKLLESYDGEFLRYDINFDELEEMTARKTARLLILCSPHNPVCRMWTRGELAKIIDICARNDVFIVSDEIHRDIDYTGEFVNILNAAGDKCENIIEISSTSKSFNTAGSHTAYITIPDEKARKKIADHMARAHFPDCSFVSEEIICAAYNKCGYYIDELNSYLGKNVKLVEKFLAERMPEVKLARPMATYLLWLDMRKTGVDIDNLNKRMICNAHVAIEPGEWFHADYRGYMRVNIAASAELVTEALERIYKSLYSK